MTEVSPLRLWVMRAMFLFMAAGIGATIWPLIVRHGPAVPHMTGVAWALLGTIGLLALLGLRYPLQLIPLLLFELSWKAIWLAAFALPRWLDGTLDEPMRTSIFETLVRRDPARRDPLALRLGELCGETRRSLDASPPGR